MPAWVFQLQKCSEQNEEPESISPNHHGAPGCGSCMESSMPKLQPTIDIQTGVSELDRTTEKVPTLPWPVSKELFEPGNGAAVVNRIAGCRMAGGISQLLADNSRAIFPANCHRANAKLGANGNETANTCHNSRVCLLAGAFRPPDSLECKAVRPDAMSFKARPPNTQRKTAKRLTVGMPVLASPNCVWQVLNGISFDCSNRFWSI